MFVCVSEPAWCCLTGWLADWLAAVTSTLHTCHFTHTTCHFTTLHTHFHPVISLYTLFAHWTCLFFTTLHTHFQTVTQHVLQNIPTKSCHFQYTSHTLPSSLCLSLTYAPDTSLYSTQFLRNVSLYFAHTFLPFTSQTLHNINRHFIVVLNFTFTLLPPSSLHCYTHNLLLLLLPLLLLLNLLFLLLLLPLY